MAKQFRVWWIPQARGPQFHVWVDDPDQGRLVLNTLARYDRFQLEHHRACSVPARHLLTGGHPDSVRWPLDVWGAVVAVAVDAYLRARYQAAVEDVSLPEEP